MDERERRRQLANVAVSSTHWTIINLVLVGAGLVAGALVGIWLFERLTSPLGLLVLAASPFVGAYLGHRLMLELWVRSG